MNYRFNKASMNFRIRRNRKKDGKCRVIACFHYKGSRKCVTLPVLVDEKKWDNKKSRIKGDMLANSYLLKLDDKFYQTVLHSSAFNNVVELANLIMSPYHQVSESVIDYFNSYVCDKRHKNDVKPSTISRYELVTNAVSDFLQSNNLISKRLCDVGHEWINKYDTFLKSEYSHLADNTRNKYHSISRTVLLNAFHEGKIKIKPYSTLKLKNVESKREFLELSELEVLLNNKFDKPGLEKARLIFLFSCFCGLRYGDAMDLKQSNIRGDSQNDDYLSFIASKPKTKQAVPLLEMSEELFTQINSKFNKELQVTQSILPRLCNTSVNKNLKEIASILKIEKKLTHRVSRHTFATLLLESGIGLEVIQKLLGHKNMRETLIYARVSPVLLRREMSNANEYFSSVLPKN